MNTIPDAYKKVPLMFQAQTKGRCQLNYIADLRNEDRDKQDVEIWTEQWTEKSDKQVPDFDETVKTQTYQLSWRFVTNGGQDDGIIRPVIGAKGFPYYPGSSMKGAFRQACQQIQPDKVNDYCGNADRPAILRFHGGYPTDSSWQENLVDLVHPQQGWQVKTNNTRERPRGESAFALISLYQPELKFGISSTENLSESDWETIWQIWEQALFAGLGCRVSAGYGQPTKPKGKIIYGAYLEGQGIASTVIGGESEFRPNIFKAAIRGHALRIFGGLTNDKTAEDLVETLFGGVTGNGKVGLLGINWNDSREPILDTFDEGYGEPTYKVEGILRWQLTRSLPEEEQKAITKLIKALMRFAMLLGGFGKSWRRIDHRLFHEEYYEGQKSKPLIGCHWKWSKRSLELDPSNLVRSLDKVGDAISQIRTTAEEWMQIQGVTPNPNSHADWREAWHPDKVQVWGRLATNKDDSEAIFWFHQAYRPEIRNAGQAEGSIYRTSLTGRMSQISRIWHRMYPVVQLRKDPNNPKKPIVRPTAQYLELLTIFSDNSELSNQFLDFLESEQKMFEKLW
jgi:CRISPR-associated protein Cmr6